MCSLDFHSPGHTWTIHIERHTQVARRSIIRDEVDQQNPGQVSILPYAVGWGERIVIVCFEKCDLRSVARPKSLCNDQRGVVNRADRPLVERAFVRRGCYEATKQNQTSIRQFQRNKSVRVNGLYDTLCPPTWNSAPEKLTAAICIA